MIAFNVGWIDLALALIGVEGLGLVAWRWSTGTGPRPAALIANLAAGGCLLIVARELATGAGALAVVAALTAALAAHGCDLWLRWERRPERRKISATSAPSSTAD